MFAPADRPALRMPPRRIAAGAIGRSGLHQCLRQGINTARPQARHPGQITAETATDSFFHWVQQLEKVDWLLRISAVASVTKRSLATLGYSGPDAAAVDLGDMDTIDPRRVQQSTPEIQAYYLFSLLRGKLFNGYNRQTFQRGAFRILDALWQKTREDFETSSEPDPAISSGNRQKMVKHALPKDSQSQRWEAIRQMNSDADTNSAHRFNQQDLSEETN